MKKQKSGFRAILSSYNDEVTGSRKLITIDRPDGTVQRILLDCGYFQEKKHQYLNYANDLDPKNIDVIIVTHSHLDHIGLVPKFVNKGYNNPIYITGIAKELSYSILKDACKIQQRDTRKLQERYPQYKERFKSLYSIEDIKNAKKLMVGLNYGKTIEILPGTKLTFLENQHLPGSAMVLLQCSCEGYEPINFFDTGDYRLESCFGKVPEMPQWLKDMPKIMTHEATNGCISSTEIKKNFRENIIKGCKEKKDIILGASAQGRMQEFLYEIKDLQNEGHIPKIYHIYVDGKLGINITMKFKKILLQDNPEKADFIPKRTTFVSTKTRQAVFDDPNPKIIITTSGMLSEGPAREYIPYFIQRKNTLIQIAVYAAEGTIARTLYEGKNEETITIRGQKMVKRAEVRTTREKSGHAFNDSMISFIKKHNNVKFLGINHGSREAQEAMKKLVEKETDIDQIGFLNRRNMYIFYQNTPEGAEYYDMQIKRVPAKLDSSVKSPDAAMKQKNRRKERQAEKAKKKRQRNNERRKRKAKTKKE